MSAGVVPPAVYVPSHFNANMVHAAPTPWQYPVEFIPPPHLQLHNPIVSPTAAPDSIDFSSPSSSPTSSLSDDAVLFSTEDVPGQPYSYFSADSQAVCAPYLGAAYDDSIQPYPQQLSLSVVPAAYGMAPLYEIFTPKTPPSAGFYSSAGFSPNPQSPWSPIERDRQRLAHYRSEYRLNLSP
jgi:hypothetical protein